MVLVNADRAKKSQDPNRNGTKNKNDFTIILDIEY